MLMYRKVESSSMTEQEREVQKASLEPPKYLLDLLEKEKAQLQEALK